MWTSVYTKWIKNPPDKKIIMKIIDQIRLPYGTFYICHEQMLKKIPRIKTSDVGGHSTP